MKKLLALLLATMMSAGTLTGCTGSGKTVTSADDLADARVAVQEMTTGDIYVGENYPNAEVSRFKSALDAGMDLKNGKVDAVVIDELPAQQIVEMNPTLSILPESLTTEEYAIAIKKGNTELVEQVNSILAAMKADGRMDKIVQAWINGDTAVQEELAAKPEPAGSETLVMGTNATFPPFETTDDAGNIVGFDVELAKEIARELGMSFRIENMNFDSLPLALDSGQITMAVAGMTVTEERLENMEFTDGYYNSTQVIIVQKPADEQ